MSKQVACYIICPSEPALSLHLGQVDSEGRIYVGEGGQKASVRAVKMKFPSNKSFTFEIRFYNDGLKTTVRDGACLCCIV